MKRKKITKMLSAFLATALTITMCDFTGIAGNMSLTAKAATVSGSQNANFDFENDLTGWDKTGTVEVKTSGAHHGNKYLHLAANSSITMTITDIKQGSYTLSAWVKGTPGKDATITVSETGGPDSQALIDTWKKTDTWNQMGHRNVLVYNGQMKITISSGNADLDLDNLELVLDAEDNNSITNWDFENGLTSWNKTGTVAEDENNVDTGAKAVRLAANSEITQTVQVEPNTKYSLTMRAKVEKQDVFETTKIESDYRKDAEGKPAIMGELQERTSLGNRVNLGVRKADGTVLRQAPSGTEDYSLISLTFTTGADDTSVEIYANTKYDDNYKESVTIYKTEGTELADNWQGNGSDNAYVDNFDLFKIQDANHLKGADVSFLPAIEDLGGKYFANGVQQDCLRILANHGVNSITNMMFVKAGEGAHYPDSLKTVYIDEYWSNGYWFQKDGSQAELKMIQGGYFDKEHSLELGKRATALGMSYLPSFHYSDTWMSAAKAFCPVEWLDTDYNSETGYKNTDLAHMQSMVYNYVYDFVKALADNHVNVCGIKHGNEQDGGIVRPVGNGGNSEGHAKLIAASYHAAEDAMPGVAGYVHTNSGYDTNKFSNLFQPLIQKGAQMDGTAFSLYGGRNSGNIVKIANFMAKDENLRYLDYINVETGFTFTRYVPTVDTAKSSMYQNKYYYMTPNGQYNWLLDYQQSALDTPNPYGQTRGFYYWETDWIPTPGAGSTDGGSADVNQRIMFNNGDPAIKEMGSSQPGKAGDMMDSMYAYLIRGCSKNKTTSLHTESSGEGDYSVEVAEPTGITLSKTSLTITEGQKERLQPTIAPTDKVLTDSNITYTSADSKIAKVTQDGFVCGVKAGTTTVTASIKGEKTATVNVTVQAAAKASGITLNVDGADIADKATKTAKLFDKIQLTSTLAGSPTNQTVVYKSSNPEVASFLGETWQTPDGEMRQETEKTDTKVQLNVVGAGTTTITAASADGEVSVSFTLNTTKVDATSVTVEPAEVSISSGRSKQLKATVAPKDTTRYKVRWESTNENIATVDENGKVTATGVGDVDIKAISDDSDTVFGVCKVHATEVKAESVEVDKEKLTLQVGSTKTLSAIVSPVDTYNKNVTWKSGDNSVATVDEKGAITGVAVGTTTITATTVDGGFTASCEVTVQKDAIPVTGITLEENEYYFASDYFSETNQSEDEPMHRLIAKVEPEMATDADVIWSSDNPEVASIDEFGRVTAVREGVATITATTKDGGFTAQAKVYVPTISESFDNREDGDTWGTKVSSTGGGALTGAVAANTGKDGKIFQISGGGSGNRSIQKQFAESIKNDIVELEFDWNVGTFVGVAGSTAGYMAITDSNNNRYLSIQINPAGELSWKVGGVVDGEILADAVSLGETFTGKNQWYHLHVTLDMKQKTTDFTITNIENNQITATCEQEFDSKTAYTGDVTAIQFVGKRVSGLNLSWNPALDNVNIYKASPIVREISVNKEKVKLIPIVDTLGAKCQLIASVIPAGADQALKWESSDTNLVTVDDKGLITPVATYNSLEEIVTGACTIKVSSVNAPSVYKEIPVEISNTPNAAEFFSIYDESGNEVYPSNENISLETGDRVEYTPVLTGGDGASDIAGIKWESSNNKVIKVDPDKGIVTAMGPGTAKVTLTVTMYAGSPQVGELNFVVAGEVLADTSALEEAIAAAKAAKDQADNYYTEESLATYKEALEKAENDLKLAKEEKWDESKQAELDKDVETLNAAVAGLEKDTSIKNISISGVNGRFWLNKKAPLTVEIEPADAEEQVIWSSSDNSVAVVDKNSGMVYPVGTGKAVITAAGANGKVSDSKEIEVVDIQDLTSYYDEMGVIVSATNTKAGRDVDYVFTNARKNDWSGGPKGEQAWSTGSTAVGIITVDLGTKARIDNVKTAFYSIMKYKLEVSDDGENWTAAVDHSEEAVGALNTSATEPFTDTFPENTQARYVRLNILENTGGGWTGVTFMQVNGAFVSDIKTVQSATCDPVRLSADTELTTSILPEKASAILSTNETVEVPITWDEDSLKKVIKAHTTGEFEVTGTITVDGIAYNIVCKLTLDEVPIDEAQVTLEGGDTYTYTGKEIIPEVAVVLKDKTLTAKDYTVNYHNNVEVGTATVIVTGTGIYTGVVQKEFTIKEASIEDAIITLEGGDTYTYTGKEIKPAVTVVLKDQTLTTNDYTVTYKNNTAVGTATVTVTGKGNYKGIATKNFTIKAAPVTTEDIKAATITLAGGDTHTYTGKEITPAVTVKLGTKTLTKDTDYTVTYKNNTAVGTATVTVTGKGKYTGTATKNFTIKPATTPVVKKNLKDAVLTLAKTSYVYDGKKKTPAVTVKLGTKTLKKDTDYTVAYTNNINAGTATVTVKAKGTAYKGTKTITFKITKKDIKKAVITLKTTKYTYNGKQKKPAVTKVTLDKVKLTTKNYSVAYSNNVNAGTAKVTITGKGNYTGKATKNFTINKASAKITLKSTSLKKALGSKNFTFGASVNSKGKLTYTSSNKKVIKIDKSKGKVVAIGEATITVKAAATKNYKATSKKLKVTVTPKKATLSTVSSKKAGQLSIKWKKDSKASGYMIQYSTSKKFTKKTTKTKTIKSNKTTSYTIKKLPKGKTYYVKVCAYKKVTSKKNICGAYSAVKKVKIKK